MVLTRKVLLLNASYEALGIVTVPRAVRVVWKGSAEVIEMDGDRVLRSPHFVFPAPSVIRLIEYIDVRGRRGRSSTKRSRILRRDRHRCQYCGTKGQFVRPDD
jgi:5-methylcytosine-specific restriction endonuclease McrA